MHTVCCEERLHIHIHSYILCLLLTYQEEGAVDHIIDTLLRMLEKDVVDNSKSCADYFEFFKNYASSVSVLNSIKKVHVHVCCCFTVSTVDIMLLYSLQVADI